MSAGPCPAREALSAVEKEVLMPSAGHCWAFTQNVAVAAAEAVLGSAMTAAATAAAAAMWCRKDIWAFLVDRGEPQASPRNAAGTSELAPVFRVRTTRTPRGVRGEPASPTLDARQRARPRAGGAQGGKHAARDGRAVQHVEVNARRAAGQQLGALQRRIRHAEVADRVGVVLARLELAF